MSKRKEDQKEYNGYYLSIYDNSVYQINKPRPYDDADYYFAQSKDKEIWTIIYKGHKINMMIGDLETVVNKLIKLNKDIKPKMIHW